MNQSWKKLNQANSGMPLPVLQKVLGHSSIRTTALYWKNSQEPREKVISDQWLAGKIPKEPTKPIENQPRELPKLPAKINNGKILLNIQQKINVFIYKPTRNLALENENKLLQEKIKQLKQENNQHNKTIENLKSDKERLKKQLIQTQQEKNTLLKLLTADLKQQQTLTQLANNEQENNQELNQQLIAQIQVLVKN